MNLLDKAKGFLARNAAKIAMTVAPLAVLCVSVPAQASVIFQTGSCSVTSFSGGSGFCGIYQATATGGNPSANGISLFGSGNSGNAFSSLDFKTGNSGSGTLTADNLPVAWDFTVSGLGSGSDSTAYYTVTETVNGFQFVFSGSTGNGEVIGSGILSIPTGTAVTDYGIELEVHSTSQFGVDIPGDSTIDLNSPAAVSAPEPASVLFALSGGGVLFFLRKSKA